LYLLQKTPRKTSVVKTQYKLKQIDSWIEEKSSNYFSNNIKHDCN